MKQLPTTLASGVGYAASRLLQISIVCLALGLLIVASIPPLVAQPSAGSTSNSQASAGEKRFPRVVGPDQVDSQLETDKEIKPLYSSELLKPYFDFKGRVKEKIGLSFAVDYSAMYLSANGELEENRAGSGMVRFYGAWDLVGRGTGHSGAVVYKVENRHAYTPIPPGSFSLESGYIGLIEPPFSDQRWRLTNLYWRQSLGGGRVSFVAGWVDPTDYVDVFALASPWLHFSNFAFSTGGASIPVPNEGLGVGGAAYLSDNLYVVGGFADSNSNPQKPGDGFDTFFNMHEYFKHFEIGWTTSRDRNFLDNVHVTVWQADERKAALTPSGWGANFSFTHYVRNKWLPFVRAGYAKDGGSLLERTVSTGIGYQRVPEGSLLGVGFNWGRPNKTTFQPGLRDQQAVEVFYRIQLSQEFALTPSLQWLNNPALAPERESTWVFGLRARLAL